jgi:hypothetical protein
LAYLFKLYYNIIFRVVSSRQVFHAVFMEETLLLAFVPFATIMSPFFITINKLGSYTNLFKDSNNKKDKRESCPFALTKHHTMKTYWGV